MLPYLEETSPAEWTLEGIMNALSRLHPNKEYSYIIYALRLELNDLMNHKKESHSNRAQEILGELNKKSKKNSNNRLAFKTEAKKQTNNQVFDFGEGVAITSESVVFENKVKEQINNQSFLFTRQSSSLEEDNDEEEHTTNEQKVEEQVNGDTEPVPSPSAKKRKAASALSSKNTNATKKRVVKENHQPIDPESREGDIAVHEANKLSMTINNKQFTVPRPGKFLYAAHKPKITKASFQSLENYVHMASEILTCNVVEINTEYKQQEEAQSKNTTLNSSPGIFEYLIEVLNMKQENFPIELWSKSTAYIEEDRAKKFVDIMKYTLTMFHCNTLTTYSDHYTHERTSFVNYVIPAFQALANVTGLIEFHWCEKELSSTRMFYLKEADYDQRKISVKSIDGLGTSTVHGLSTEQIMIESSSGLSKEHVPHTLEDTVKLIESSTIALSMEATNHINASIKTFKKMKAFSVHIIKDHITLSATSLYDKTTWKNVELRTSLIPSSWSGRLHWIKFFELLLTLMNELYSLKQVQENLLKESMGAISFDGETVRDFLKA